MLFINMNLQQFHHQPSVKADRYSERDLKLSITDDINEEDQSFTVSESNSKHQDYSDINIVNAITVLSYSSLCFFLKHVPVTICESGVEDKSHIHFLLQTVLITISLNHSDKLYMIED